jgi:hypothetical protein
MKRSKKKDELTSRFVTEKPTETPKPTVKPTQKPKILQTPLQKQMALKKVETVIQKQNVFSASEEGKEAREFCTKAGAKGNSLIGCMQDMRLTENKKIAKAAVKATNQAITINRKKTGVKRVCTATGDPHFTNFNGEYFHLQSPMIFTLARTKDGRFEVQALETKRNRRDTFTYMNRAVVKYDGVVYNTPFDKDGLSVKQSGDTVTVTATDYEGEMEGICGENAERGSARNFRTPSGQVVDVAYKTRGWEMSGYAPNGKLTLWQKQWIPSKGKCLFSEKECASYAK